MAAQKIDTQPYLAKVIEWKVQPFLNFVGNMADHPIEYEMGLTPQIEEEPEWCIFMVKAIKEVESSENGKVVDCQIQFGFKIKEEGKNLTPIFLFQILQIVHHNFKEQYLTRNKGHHSLVYNIDAPIFKDYENSLRIVIMGQGTSKQ